MMIGRRPEVATLAGVLDAARHGSPRSILVTGDPGMGKSLLLRQTEDSAPDFTILRTTAVASESEFPYAALHELLHQNIAVLDEIPDIQAGALRGALAISEAPGSAPLNIGAGVLSAVAALASKRPVLCLVDDAQWLDAASLAAMQFAFRRLHAERVAVVVAADHPRPMDTTVFTDTISLGGLELEDAVQVMNDAAPDVTPSVAHELWTATEGNPGAMLDMSSLLTPGQRSGVEPLPVPLPVHVAVPSWLSAQIDELSPQGRRALLRASIAGTETHRVVHRDDLVEGMAEAEAAGLIAINQGKVTIGHRMTPAQMLELSSAEERREAHRQIAEALRLEGRNHELRWQHLAAGATGPDDVVASEIGAGAVEIRNSHGHGVAAGLLEAAARLTTDASLCSRYTVDAAHSAWLAGQPRRAITLLDRVPTEEHDPSVRLTAALSRVQLSRAVGSPAAFPADLDLAADPTRGVAWLMASSLNERDPHTALEVAQHALELARDRALTVTWAAELAVMRATDAAADPVSAAKVIDAGAACDWANVEASADVLVEALECLTTWSPIKAAWLGVAIERLTALAHSRALAAVPLAALASGDAAFVAGRWADATVSYNAARSTAVESGQQRTVDRAKARLDVVEVLRGVDLVEGVDRIPAGVSATIASTWSLAHGGSSDALRAATGVDWHQVREWLPPGSISAPDLVAAAVRLDEVPSPMPISVMWAAERSWCEGLTDTDAPAHLLDCLQWFDDGDASFVSARILGTVGQRLLRSQHRTEAREQLRRALAIFVQLGATPWAEQMRRDLEATGIRVAALPVSDLESLTPRELQIARCVASGSTYKEVAAELFLGVKTIEFHLGNAYRKLNITSRRELAPRLAELGDAP